MAPRLFKVSRANRKENPEARMSIGDHLRELRDRLFISAVAVMIASIAGWFLFDAVFSVFTAPIEVAKSNGYNISMNFDTVLSSFDIRMKTAIWVGVFIASPIWMYEFWAYVAPGMTKKERRYTAGYGLVGLLLFSAGAALGVWILPHAITILTSFIPKSGTGFIQVRLYLSFVMRLILVFGAAFLLPEILVGLNSLGLIKGKTLLKGWRWAVVLIFAFMAVANPLPDPWSMVFMAIPITGLYFLACWISIQHDKRVEKRKAKINAELDAALAADPKSDLPAITGVEDSSKEATDNTEG